MARHDLLGTHMAAIVLSRFCFCAKSLPLYARRQLINSFRGDTDAYTRIPPDACNSPPLADHFNMSVSVHLRVLCCFALSLGDGAAQTSHSFRPSQADPAITTFDNLQYAYVDQSVPNCNRLLVFLPGTTGTPYFYREILKHAATLGYHSLGLMYPNNRAVGTLCAIHDRRNPDCPRDVRLEILDGTDRTSLVEVDRTHCIENRLIRALQYVASQHPSEGWERFLKEDEIIVWDHVAIAGHSQGGGHAAMIAKRYEVNRCLIFAAADWFPFEDRLANWPSEPGATPAHRHYLFGHVRDPLVDWDHQRAFASGLDLDRLGGPVRVDEILTALPPRHIFTTDMDVANFHNTVVVDAHTPLDAQDQPLFRPVWKHMLLAESPTLSFEVTDSQMAKLYWHSGVLERSTDLIEWEPLPTSNSPMSFPLNQVGTQVFFRVLR